jgi:hypothetical protein
MEPTRFAIAKCVSSFEDLINCLIGKMLNMPSDPIDMQNQA